MRRLLIRVLAGAAATAALVVAAPGVASAHPLGNFTVNRYSGIVVGTDRVTVDHVLDLAEIPTAQRVPSIDSTGDSVLSRPELASWAATTCEASAAAMQLTVAGTRSPLTVTSAVARTVPGQAGLPTLRVECALAAVVEITGPSTLRLVDTAAGQEVGWKEMTARGDAVLLGETGVPDRTSSGRLSSYPEDLLSSPLDVGSIRLEVRPGGTHLQPDPSGSSASSDDAVAASGAALSRGADRLTLAFEDLTGGYDDGPLLALAALLAALGLGAAHALAPGHGKTIMAFYLSGRRESARRSAATVGATVTVTHTAGVLALGLLVSAGTRFVPGRVYPWLSVASGLLVVAVGLMLLRDWRRGGHAHAPDGSHIHPGAPHRHPHPHPGTPHPGTPHSHPLHLHGDHAALVLAGASEAAPARTAALGDHALVGTLVRTDARAAVHDHGHPHDHDHDHDHGHAHEHEQPHAHDHPHGDDHPHPHEHPHGHAHSDHPQPSRRGLVGMGLAGGLVPSPSALLVFLGALSLGHPWFGVGLVVAFGLGMAGTLAGVGLVVLRLRERAERRLASRPRSRFAPLLRLLPGLTAVAVVLLGALVALTGVARTGVI